MNPNEPEVAPAGRGSPAAPARAAGLVAAGPGQATAGRVKAAPGDSCRTLVRMCGIVGYVGQRPACGVVMDALRRMEYRGYDSSGIALVDGHGKLTVRRRAGRLANLESALAETAPAELGGR